MGAPSGPSRGTDTHHASPSRSPAPPGERATLGSWTTSRAPPSRSAAQVAVPGLAGGRAPRSHAVASASPATSGCPPPKDALPDDVQARRVRHVLDREPAQRLQPGQLRRRRRASEGHRHDGARAVGPGRDLERLDQCADERQAVTDSGRVTPRRDTHPVVDDLDDQPLAIVLAAHAHLPRLSPDVGVDHDIGDRLRHREPDRIGQLRGRSRTTARTPLRDGASPRHSTPPQAAPTPHLLQVEAVTPSEPGPPAQPPDWRSPAFVPA